MISVIIPSYKDPYLYNTVKSLQDNAKGDIEIIVVADGYAPEKPLDGCLVVHLAKNVGMRGAINRGVDMARGEYLMRVDEHCMFGKGYDRILTEAIEDNWIVTPRRYKLDPVKWERFGEPIDYEKMVIATSLIGKRKGGKKFHGKSCSGPDGTIGEKTSMQGSCWLMAKSWWDNVIVALDTEGYGTHYQDSTEMLFKTWQAGGKLMLNRGTWYAHKAKEFPRTHHYPTALAEKSWAYAIEHWGGYFYEHIKDKAGACAQ